MTLRPTRHLHALLERYVPERRLFIRSEDHTRFLRLTPVTQLLAWSGGTVLVGWSIVASAILLMDGIGSSSFRDQAARDQTIYENRLNALITDRDGRASEALAAQERFDATLDQVSDMQSELLDVETRRQEAEVALRLAQDTLRRTLAEREAARADLATFDDSRPSGSMEADELGWTLDALNGAMEETVAERDRIAVEAEEAVRLAGELDVELRLMKEQSDEIFTQVEDALAVSVEPLDEVFQAAGLDPERLIDEVQGSRSGDESPDRIQVSTMGSASTDDETVRANRILDRLDEINQYRIALEQVPLAMPVQDAFRYTSPFGPRWGRMHEGVDMAGPVGTPIYATADGVVTFAGWQNGYGRIIKVQHEFGLETRYPHLNAMRVQVGQRVARGERIGDMGNSGRSTGPHLHYEVRVNGEAVDPMTYIRAGRELP